MAAKVRAIPEGSHTVTPHLVVRGAAKAIDFYKNAFGAQEIRRMPGPGGAIMFAEIRIGDSRVYLNDEFPNMGAQSPQGLGGTAVAIHLWVENADALFQRATEAGARVIMPLGDQFWGDRYGQLEDPFGHRWAIATHVKDMTPEEMQQAAAAAFAPR